MIDNSSIRKRRLIKTFNQETKSNSYEKNVANECYNGHSWISVLHFMFGTCLMVMITFKYSVYIKTLHENNLWFSKLKVSLK